MEEKLNKILDTFTMMFTNVNTITHESLVQLIKNLQEVGRMDLADALANDMLAAGLPQLQEAGDE